MGSIQGSASYSVSEEAKRILNEGIFNNPKISRHLSSGVGEFASRVKITGNDLPSIPINWRLAESVAALQAFEACLIATLVQRKYGVDVVDAEINADHASLLMMCTLMYTVHPGTEHEFKGRFDGPHVAKLDALIPNYDFHRHASSPHRINTSSIYPTKDGKFFHLHGGLNPDITLQSLGLPLESDAPTLDEAYPQFLEKIAQYDSDVLDHMAADVYKQSGCIVESRESFLASEHGKANAHVSLFEVFKDESSTQAPSWWSDAPETSAARPLAGLKVVDLTRVIAAPMATRGLAELGASIMRVTSPNLVDYSCVHIELNWGKWTSSLDLRDEQAREQLRELILDADVVVQGYRPGIMDKFGFSQQDIIEMVKDRPRGIISVRENSYGWYGPYKDRTGWQEISDANTGISVSLGKAQGLQNGEPVTPFFPNSDCMTGLAGTLAILTALLRRGQDGGSYRVDFALNYYNQWLAESVGEYPSAVWEDVWSRHGRLQFR